MRKQTLYEVRQQVHTTYTHFLCTTQ